MTLASKDQREGYASWRSVNKGDPKSGPGRGDLEMSLGPYTEQVSWACPLTLTHTWHHLLDREPPERRKFEKPKSFLPQNIFYSCITFVFPIVNKKCLESDYKTA
jgi:hypothetical protein